MEGEGWNSRGKPELSMQYSIICTCTDSNFLNKPEGKKNEEKDKQNLQNYITKYFEIIDIKEEIVRCGTTRLSCNIRTRK